MTQLKRVELPPTFGVNVANLSALKGGKLQEILSKIITPFDVVSRLKFRATVDVGGLDEPVLAGPSISSSRSMVAFANLGSAAVVYFFTETGSFSLSLSHTVTCIHLIDDHLFVSGNSAGEIELWNLRLGDPIFEAKCLYRFSCNVAGVFPILCSASEETFQVILSKGKCMLSFDTIACASGNTDESAVAPVIIDLLQPPPIVFCDSTRDGSLATLSESSVCITNINTHKAISFDVNAVKCLWANDIGHLYVILASGEVWDCAWSSGLVGVSTVPSCIEEKPSSMEKIDLTVDPARVDLTGNRLVTMEDGNIIIYSRKQGANQKQYPVSPSVTEFELEKQLPVHKSPDEDVLCIKLCGHKFVCVVLKNNIEEYRSYFVTI